VFACSVLFILRLPSSLAHKDDVSKQTVYKCPYPDSPNAEQHEKFLNGLNGKRIVFIGDSLTRYCAQCNERSVFPDGPSSAPGFTYSTSVYVEQCYAVFQCLFAADACRFQYITLASFVAKGVCPGKDTESRALEYHSLYRESSVWWVVSSWSPLPLAEM
jgi:hypothetical protein